MYVFDNSSLRVLCESFYPARFPSLWEKFNILIYERKIISVREVYKEIITWNPSRRLVQWAKENKDLFPPSSPEELEFLNIIFSVRHFQSLIGQKQILQGTPVADPFVIAKGKIEGRVVVTQESLKKNAAKIPNVCDHFNIPYMNLEGFMEKEGWEF
jgi:hypothetical protein